MTRTQARRRRKRRQRLRQIGAWTTLFLVEILAAAVPAAILVAILLPLAQRERDYIAVGSEWLAISATFCITYSILHLWICKKIFKEG